MKKPTQKIISLVIVFLHLLYPLEGFAENIQSLAPKSIFAKRLSQHVVRRTLSGHFPKSLRASPVAPHEIREFANAYNRAVKLTNRLAEGVGWRERIEAAITTSSHPVLRELYGSLFQSVDRRRDFLKLLRKIFWKRGIEYEIEVAPTDDPQIQNRLLTTQGRKILIHPDARVGDLLFYLPHEMIHVAGGSEIRSRFQDVLFIKLIKALASELRRSSQQPGFKDRIYLQVKADLLELEALDWELDLLTARLERIPVGQGFLKKHSLGRLSDVTPDILDAMSEAAFLLEEEEPQDILNIQPIWNVLEDDSKSFKARRRIFDYRLLRFLTRSSIQMATRSYILTRHGEERGSGPRGELDSKRLLSRVHSHEYRGFFYVLLSAILGGVLPMIGKDLLNQYPMFGVLFVRECWVAVLLTPFLFSKKIPNPTFEQILMIGFFSLFMTGVSDPLYYGGLKLTSPLAAFLIYSTADLFFLALASKIFFKERLTVHKWIGAVLTFIGTFLIAWGEVSVGKGSFLGVLMVLASSLLTVVWTVVAKKALKNIHPMAFIAVTFWAGLPILLAYSKGDVSSLISPQMWLWASMTAIVYIVYYKGLKWISAMTVSVIDSTSPIFTALFSSFQKLKFPSLMEVGSLVLTTLGVLTFVYGVKRQRGEKHKMMESSMGKWRKLGKDVTERLESYMTADEGITLPTFVDVSDLDEDYGTIDLLQAMSYYIHGSNVPNGDVFGIIFRKLDPERALKFLMDAKEEAQGYLENNLSDEDRKEQLSTIQAIEIELGQRFSLWVPAVTEPGQTPWSNDPFTRAAFSIAA